MVAEQTFEVVYVQTAENAVLCRYQVGKSGITVTNTVNEEVALFVKWESVKAWWHAKSKGELVVNEKLEKASSEGDENNGTTTSERLHRFKCEKMSDLVECMTKSLSSLLKAQQSAILDIERENSVDEGEAKKGAESSSQLTFKLEKPVEGNLMKQRNKFPKTWQRRFFVLVEEDGYCTMKYFPSREEYMTDAAPLGSVDLRTVEKFTYSGDLIYFEAFQPNKDRSKEWVLKGDPTSTKEVLNNWATVLQEIYDDVKSAQP
ncbi:hypothetical protein A3770_05p39570 [Chloropicon primus]|uniref:PH domain-containing protein n=1 Tax=Chloropicon primus TaxID=1764295 RepID=A0A5B8MLW6_9CHLO|nr:hypothetical protein A3770_05p39570 [Chloropicon primus]|eukprot:QDZ21439.1 hypothetical protein A3770_05p39570 [Chloropicon primus]